MGEWKPLTSMKQHLSLPLTSPSTRSHEGNPGTALANLAHCCNKQESEVIKQMSLPNSMKKLTPLTLTPLKATPLASKSLNSTLDFQLYFHLISFYLSPQYALGLTYSNMFKNALFYLKIPFMKSQDVYLAGSPLASSGSCNLLSKAASLLALRCLSSSVIPSSLECNDNLYKCGLTFQHSSTMIKF